MALLGYRPDVGKLDGLSLTLDREVAQMFDNRVWFSLATDKPFAYPQNRGRGAERRVKKSEVFACVTERRESEGILLPRRSPQRAFQALHEQEPTD